MTVLLIAAACLSSTVETVASVPATVQAAPPERDYLALAADSMKREDEAQAVLHLTAHLRERPQAVMIRAYLAELLLKLGKPLEAQRHFTLCTRSTEPTSPAFQKHLVHCHTRLMEIAAEQGQNGAEHFHRGVALLMLIQQWDQADTHGSQSEIESTLCKCVGALRVAVEDCGTDPQVWFYLASAYQRWGRTTACRSAASRASALLPDAGMSDEHCLRLQEWLQPVGR